MLHGSPLSQSGWEHPERDVQVIHTCTSGIGVGLRVVAYPVCSLLIATRTAVQQRQVRRCQKLWSALSLHIRGFILFWDIRRNFALHSKSCMRSNKQRTKIQQCYDY